MDKQDLVKAFQRIESLLPEAMCRDRWACLHDTNRIQKELKKKSPSKQIGRLLGVVEKRLVASIQKKNQRRLNRPDPVYNPRLPITAEKDNLIAAVKNRRVVIVSGETGSGKTTQIPKFCLAAGLGIKGKIGCTQPRRIAAVSMARRLAEEFNEKLGKSVGYKIRFSEHGASDAYIKYMTDGILLAETRKDPYLSEYDAVIVDEAHERSLNIDFVLGFMKRLLKQRDDLKLIISSATMDTEKFSHAFDQAPVMEVSGRMFPVETTYFFSDKTAGDEQTHTESAAAAVDQLINENRPGDMLIFMPTEQDIRETCDLIASRKYGHTAIFPLYAALPAAEQADIFLPLSERKIIVATNIAETSLTIPGIKYVIDSGLARISQYSSRTRTTGLPVVPISKGSADQRKGRCGRVENGMCIRLYPEADYESRALFTMPEILRTGLAGVILQMTALKIGDVSDFPFIDKPSEKNIKHGMDLLLELGALEMSKKTKKISLTETGRFMAELPIDPRLSKILIEARTRGCLDQALVIVSALSIKDPRERPAEHREAADQAHSVFIDPLSDFVTLYNIWSGCHKLLKRAKSNNRMKKYCKDHFLSYRRMREWLDVHDQLRRILQKSDRSRQKAGKRSSGRPKEPSVKAPSRFTPLYTALHKSILSGFLSNIAVKKEKNLFLGAKQKEVMIFPGSGLFDRADKWIMSAERVKTSRLFARTVAAIDVSWIEEVGRNLCRYRHLHPVWAQDRGEVIAYEQATLFGLVVAADRPVSYRRIDPEKASDIFIQSALVQEQVDQKPPFMIHNRSVIDSVTAMEHKIRRRDLLIHEDKLVDFYKSKLPTVSNMKELNQVIQKKKSDDFLRLTKEDVLNYTPHPEELDRFPDTVRLGSHHFDCLYRFNPGKKDDGLTIKIPYPMTGRVPKETIDWVVPGLIKEKITALIKGLPKAYRRRLVPLPEKIDHILSTMEKTKKPIITALGDFIYRAWGVDIPASAWPLDDLPDYLKARITVTDASGAELASGRNAVILNQSFHPQTDARRTGSLSLLKQKWEQKDLTSWSFADLPAQLPINETADIHRPLYPGLEKDSSGRIHLRLFQDPETASASHRQGVAALFSLHLSSELKFLKKNLTIPKGEIKKTIGFGGPRSIETMLYEKVIHHFFYKNIRSKHEFIAHGEDAKGRLIPTGRILYDRSMAVLNGYDQALTVITDLEPSTGPGGGDPDPFFDHMRNELDKLVPKNFITLYDEKRWTHLIRYIKAIEIRAQRAFNDFEKDRHKATLMNKHSTRLARLIADLSPLSSQEKKDQVENYFWMVEEYKVSLFAQELKTAIPVSEKRLDQYYQTIERTA